MARQIRTAILALVLLLGVSGCGGARGALTSLEDITDEMIVSGALGYSQRMWSSSRVNSAYEASWRQMTGTDTCMTLTYCEEEQITVAYAVADPGAGFRVVLVLPDETVLDLTEGAQTVTLPMGETRVVLAAYKTGGAFSLEIT